MQKSVSDIQVGDFVMYSGWVKAIEPVASHTPAVRFTFESGASAIFRKAETLLVDGSARKDPETKIAQKKYVYILWFTDPNSYHSTRGFEGVFETIEGATEAIPERFRNEKDRMPAEGDTVVQFYGFEVKRTELGA